MKYSRLPVAALALISITLANAVESGQRPARFELGYVMATAAPKQESKYELSKPVFHRLRDSLAVSGVEEDGWLFLTSEVGVPILIDLKEGLVADALARRQLWRELDSAVGEDGLVHLSKLSVNSAKFLLNYFGFGDSATLSNNRTSIVMLTCEAYLIDATTGENLGESMTKPIIMDEYHRKTQAMQASPFEITAQSEQVRNRKSDLLTHPKQSLSLRACLIKNETESIESLNSASETIFSYLKPILTEQKRLEEAVMRRIGSDIKGVDETRLYAYADLPAEIRQKIQMTDPTTATQSSSKARYRMKKHVLLNVMFKNGNTVSYIAVSIKH